MKRLGLPPAPRQIGPQYAGIGKGYDRLLNPFVGKDTALNSLNNMLLKLPSNERRAALFA